MASFTFGAGNARKLIRLPLYALGAFATLFVPRTRQLWVFGSGIGPGEGAVPLYRAASARLGIDVRLVWLAGSTEEISAARELGLEAQRRDTWRGFWLTMRARVLVVTHGFGDVNRYATRGGFVVQLWHGFPFKKLHIDAPAAMRLPVIPDSKLVRAIVASAYRRAGRGISLFPVSSALAVPRIASAFGVPADRVVVTGDPRDDVLLEGDARTISEKARTTLENAVGPLPADSDIILFAPTWRDGDADPAAPTAPEWDAIVAWLERNNCILLVRTHPLGKGDYAAGPTLTPRVKLLGADRLREVNPILSTVDAVVTDYSSIVYDFALVGGPIVFLAADLESYRQCRGFYEPYQTYSGGRAVSTWGEALAELEDGLAAPVHSAAARHTTWLREEYLDCPQGGAAERVLDEILRRTDGLPAATRSAARVRVAVLAIRFDLDEPALIIGLDTVNRPVSAAALVGGRGKVDSTIRTADGSIELRFPLLSPRWNSEPLALPSGDYVLEIGADRPTSRVTLHCEPPRQVRHAKFHASVLAEAGQLILHVTAPLRDDERGPRAQRALERTYRRSTPTPRDAVFFESFYGQSASCNPRGVDEALVEVSPGTMRYWSVVDGSVEIPAGATAVVEGSREWWQARADSRMLVVNDWLRKRYKRRLHQHVLQTWHGTTLKRLALDRPDQGLRARIAARREGRRWDALLAQNQFTADNLASAYDYRGPIWVEGYPRNDVLRDDAAALRIRARLGVPQDTKLVLYAPTWRDDRRELVNFLDLELLTRSLGPSHTVLVRGHSRTLQHGSDRVAPNVLDVTSYPHMADLLLVADVFVTDYSSAMFDWSSTGKPIVFFVPDLDHYGEKLRGFYFDLLADPPGPVTRTTPELIEALRRPHDQPGSYRAAAMRWQTSFACLDDGHAGRRVVDRIIEQGWL